MPRLPGAEELGNPVSGRSGRPVATYDGTALARGAQALGAGIASFGADVGAIAQTQKAEVSKEKAFETQRRFLEFSSAQDEALINASQKAEPGAFGFREAYQSQYMKDAKAFFSTVPDELKGQYDSKLFAIEDQLSNKALTFEREQRKSYYSAAVNDGLTKIENDLYANPDNFTRNLTEGNNYIDALPDDVTPIEKETLKREWRRKAQLASLNGMAPKARMTALGEMGNPGDIIGAMIDVESTGNPSAVSSKGAVGLMQVLPSTAAEIAKELGDPNFPASAEDRVAYLKRPDVSKRYGTHYFNKMLARYNGDTEAALIAYNGGAERADKWLSAGRDDSVIPRESADYYKKVMGKARIGERDRSGDLPIVAGDAKGLGRISSPDIDNVSPEVLDRFREVQNAFGASIPIVSGYRDKARNARAKGASGSKHIDGQAIDLDVSNMPKEERLRLIETASAMGFTGIGVYANSIHLDVGNRRAWGPSHGGESVPGWAKDTINRHLASTAQPVETRGRNGFKVDPRFSDMSYVDREKVVAGAQTEIKQQETAAAAAAKANYTLFKDSMTLGIETGDVKTEAEILTSALDDGDKATLLKALRSKNKEDIDVRDLVGAIVAGDDAASVNPFDADERKTGDKAYEAMTKAVSADQAPAVTETFIRETGYIPKAIQADIRQGAEAKDPATLSQALSRADALSRIAPISFEAIEGGKAMRDKAAMYSHFVNDLGMSGPEAAQRILRMNDEAVKVNREVLKPEAAKFTKTLEVSDVTDAFDPGIFSAEPGAGAMPIQANGLLAEYRELAEASFYETGGDPDAAKALALTEIKKRWNVSNITGSPNLMRMPPELHYPSIKDGHAYLRDDAMKTAQEYVADNFEGRQVENVALLATRETRADIEMGRPPRYRLFYQYQEDGQTKFDEVFAGLWGISPDELNNEMASDKAEKKARFIEERDRNAVINRATSEAQSTAQDEVRRIQEMPISDTAKAAESEAAQYKARLEEAKARQEINDPGRADRLKADEQMRQEAIARDRKSIGNFMRGGITLPGGN